MQIIDSTPSDFDGYRFQLVHDDKILREFYVSNAELAARRSYQVVGKSGTMYEVPYEVWDLAPPTHKRIVEA